MAFGTSSAALANDWENPQETYGLDWECSRMEVGNPTYDICKKCLSTNGTFYWKKPVGQTEFDRRLEYYVGRCMRPGTESDSGQQPRADDMGSEDHVYENQTTPTVKKLPKPARRLWSAVAAGFDKGFLGMTSKEVSIGIGRDYATREEAERAAKKACRKNVKKCKIVGAWNSGCYWITSGRGGGVAWGAGKTPQAAYDQCRSRVTNCDTTPLGKCYPE